MLQRVSDLSDVIKIAKRGRSKSRYKPRSNMTGDAFSDDPEILDRSDEFRQS